MALRDQASLGHFDFESMELLIRTSVQGLGKIVLEEILNFDDGYRGPVISDNNRQAEFKEYRDKKLHTVLGRISVGRAYYHDKNSHAGYCPKDYELDIVGTSFSPGLARIMARVGAYRPFGVGSDDIKELAGISVTPKEIERVSCRIGKVVEAFSEKENPFENVIPFSSVATMYVCMDGTGVPVTKKEAMGRWGKAADGTAKTREVKLGCVFTQTRVDEKGRAIRDEASTSYVGSIETAEKFGDRLYSEARRRGMESSQKVCVIGDGAPWIWNLADLHFYEAVQIIDIYHAREHCWSVGRELLGADKEKLQAWIRARIIELDEGRIEDMITSFRQLRPSTHEQKAFLDKEIQYFSKNRDRMRYGEFRDQGLFVGSGVVEAGCRAVIGQRLKQSGMHWTVEHANNIIALRCCIMSDRWEDFWESRACA